MDFIDRDLILYLVIILVFLGFFLWNRSQTKKNRQDHKNRNFRKRYHDRKRRKNQ